MFLVALLQLLILILSQSGLLTSVVCFSFQITAVLHYVVLQENLSSVWWTMGGREWTGWIARSLTSALSWSNFTAIWLSRLKYLCQHFFMINIYYILLSSFHYCFKIQLVLRCFCLILGHWFIVSVNYVFLSLAHDHLVILLSSLIGDGVYIAVPLFNYFILNSINDALCILSHFTFNPFFSSLGVLFELEVYWIPFNFFYLIAIQFVNDLAWNKNTHGF